MSDQRPPVLRMKCQHCGSRKHAVQYKGERVVLLPHGRELHYDRPGVSLQCPVCDAPVPTMEAA